MKMYPSRFLCHAITLVAVVASCSGCVKRMSAVNEPAQTQASAFATLRSVNVSADASRIELLSDRPLTYTSYKAGEPAKIVVDISQTEPGAVATPIEVNRGSVRRIDVVRQAVGGGVLTRVEIALARDVDFAASTDPADRKKLVVTLAAGEGESKPSPQEAKPAAEIKEAPPIAESRIEEKSLNNDSARAPEQSREAAPAAGNEPAKRVKVADATPGKGEGYLPPSAPRKAAAAISGPHLNAILTTPDGVEVSVEGGAVQTFNTFKLTKPDRVVIDMFGVKSGLDKKIVPISAFGVANARVGTTPDKLRIVLDASGETLPPYQVVKTDLGIKIRFKTGTAQKPAEKPAAAPVVIVAAPAPAETPAAAPVKSPAPAAAPAPVAAAAPAAAPAPVAVAAPVATPAQAPAPAAVTAPAAPVHAAAPVAAAAAPVPAPARTAPAPAPAEVKTEAVPPRNSKGAVEAVDFKIVDGHSRITLKVFGTCEPTKPVRGVQGISLTIPNCQVPNHLQRTLDTSKFGTPVLSVTPYQVKAKGVPVAKLLVRLRGTPRFTMSREGDLVLLDVVNPGPVPAPKLPAAPAATAKAPAKAPAKAREPKVAEAKAVEPRDAEELAPPRGEEATELPMPDHARSSRKTYTGRRVTLEFSDADIRKIFQLIAEVSNLNFLIGDDVTGTISLKLVNVPWDQALDVILDAKGLGMQREGNIVQIKPKSKMQTQAQEELAAKKAVEATLPLRTVIFEVNYAAIGDIATQFAALKSDRGSIIKDERTNRVIVNDIQPSLDSMRQLLKNLDIAEKQVMIEARIVEASSTFTRDLGVQWEMHYKDGSASFANINSVDSTFGGVVSGGPSSTGSGGIGMGMSFGKLTSNIQLDMRLSAAATIGEVKIVSTPKVVTLNNKAAKISQGQSIPYQTTSAEGTKTEFVEAALTLEVTPHITADGSVSMKIKASNNSPGTGSPPPINKKEATTELLVANGETTVIGGIYQDTDTESDTGIPFLSDIPLLGWLFKSNSKAKSKTELLIFITPKVVI